VNEFSRTNSWPPSAKFTPLAQTSSYATDRSIVVYLLFVTSSMVSAYSTLRLIICIYRNSAIFFTEV